MLRNQWDKGYAKEITRAFIKYARDVLYAKVVIGEVYKFNDISRNVFQKLGFKELPYPGRKMGLYIDYYSQDNTRKIIWYFEKYP